MKHSLKALSIIIIFIFLFNILSTYPVSPCKDIVATDKATAGKYNLLLKVRDPSRSGIQVLHIVPQGYKYTYHHPWTGEKIEFTTKHKYIGVTTKGDTIPSIVKSGMALNDAGLAFGDADSLSNWVNPTRHAWDDFDWIRYACQTADTEQEAVNLLTKKAVDKLHAPGVSENLFLVGPEKAFVIEGDVIHHNVKEIDDIFAMTNYPKELWKTQYLQRLPVSPSFDTTVEKWVRKKTALRLHSLYGIRITDIGENWVEVKPIPFLHGILTNSLGEKTKISINERKTIGYYSVTPKAIDGKYAKISMCTKYKAWQDTILEKVKSRYGKIDIKEMINLSRLHKKDLQNLRPMCENKMKYEGTAIYKIPPEKYEMLSSGWFSANHACSTVYVPFHICNNKIYDPYETGEATKLSMKLLDLYGHGNLTEKLNQIENVFLNEVKQAEKRAEKLIEKNKQDIVPAFLTTIDTNIQKQAFKTQQIWKQIKFIDNPKNKDEVSEIVEKIWNENYIKSISSFKHSLKKLKNIPESSKIREIIEEIALNIYHLHIDTLETLGKQNITDQNQIDNITQLIENENYEQGFNLLEEEIKKYNSILEGKPVKTLKKEKQTTPHTPTNLVIYTLIILSALIIISIYLYKKRK